MTSSILTRFYRKDVLFQVFSDLVRHNSTSSNNTVHSSAIRNKKFQNQLIAVNVASNPIYVHCLLQNRPFTFNDGLHTNRMFSTMSHPNDPSNELIDFKNLSVQERKTINKTLCLKSSLFQELPIFTSSDLKKIAFDYYFYLNDNLFTQRIDFIKSETNAQNETQNCFYREQTFQNDTSQTPNFLFWSGDNAFKDLLSNKNLDFLKDQTIVIFDNPFDALAFQQQTKNTSITLKILKDIDKNNQDFNKFCYMINRYKKIYLWSNNDAFQQSFRKSCIENLDLSKVYIVYSNNSALQMLQLDSKEKFTSVLESAMCINHPSIITFGDLKNDIFKELTDPAVNGVQWSRFPKFNEHLKGHRPGELTIVTGPTGCGKTTFVSEYSLDLCMQGVPTLWGSFEIKNIRLAKMMLTQFSRKNFVAHKQDEFEEEAEKFKNLPLYFMKFHGQTDVNLVLEAAKHAVVTLGVKHLIIDNLQFMLGLNVDSNIDRFLKQDFLISALRHFSTRFDCHITLVAHPRKEKEEFSLSNNSLYGGVKASQEADNVFIILNKFHSRFRCNKYIQITKNRYNGSLGIVPLYFDKNTLCFSTAQNQQTLKQCTTEGLPETATVLTGDANLVDSKNDNGKEMSDFYEVRYLFGN